MPVTRTRIDAVRRRLAHEHGFTMLMTLAVLAFVLLFSTVIFLTAQGEVHTTQHDLEGKRAYAAAQAATNVYLHQLNESPNYWSTCTDDYQTTTPIPGATTSEEYSYSPVLANGNTSCSSSNAIVDLIDSSTQTLRMEFTGYAGNPGTIGDPQVSRTIVASFRKESPFDYLWYTVYEAADPALGSYYSQCGQFLRTGSRPSQCNINWVTGDAINGPMYTQDQLLINGSPTFGRTPTDYIRSAAPGPAPQNACANNNNGTITMDSCGSANIKGTMVSGWQTISPPATDTQLYTDATNYGKTYSGVTYITLNGTTATVQNCPSSCTTTTVDLTQYPLIYVSNGSGCTPYTYSPFRVTYLASGCTGDAYVSGTYTTPVTIGTANNIIINGNLTTTNSNNIPTGNATLGLVANQFIRVMHGENYNQYGQCSGDISNETFPNIMIDAAMLAVQHSFIVDNYNCGSQLGKLNVDGAIAQYYRGPVGTVGNPGTGYLKSYSYDDRLKVLLPPYLFDIATSDWAITRETLCTPGGSSGAGCNAPG